MATLTRSTRRIDGLHPHHANANTHLIATSAARNAGQTIFPRGATARNKRPLDGSECDFDALNRKRTRITVEILSRVPSAASRSAIGSVAPPPTVAPQRPPQRLQQVNPRQAQHPALNPPAHSPDVTASTNPDTRTTNATLNQSEQLSHKTNSTQTKHQSKVKNGILHELDRLEPAPADSKSQGRKLRSQETSRFKSELSAYFPEYDEVIGNEPKEKHLLNLDTPIVILETSPPAQQMPSGASATASNNTNTLKTNTGTSPTISKSSGALPYTSHQTIFLPRHYSDALFDELYDAQRIDFGFLETRYKGKSLDDPLPDSYFEPAHKKAERLEKSIRNAEKGRAQHERDRIIRLLDGLQGHDWLRVMGVSGITESRKKSFEPARDHFIRGCEAILAKFRRWNREEKRRKQEKDRAAIEQAHSKEVDTENGSSDDPASLEGSTSGDGDEDTASHRDDGSIVSEPLSDVDASIAKQLQEEVLARSRIISDPSITNSAAAVPAIITTSTDTAKGKSEEDTNKKVMKSRAKPPPKAAKHEEPEPAKEFTSFFAKKHERDMALSSNRRAGRRPLAWGLPIPEMPEADYELPEEVMNAEAMKMLARKRRQDRRGRRS
ncbi:uncharacterized protein DNG_10329 [Cephalotrichum gorgonifer]|uniref:Something about silencing protein 4 domain-containing protein n=1 Tax=Cephalotrichum gorgonifer TaxID=2041049 RepID=A0AAE8T037_9PEZI|nr:uncharacterized protein DNG_10329 [Cephalotrichum gorgonifer]